MRALGDDLETPLTVERAAEILGVSHMSVRRYMRDGRLPVRRLGREYLLYPSDLRGLIRPVMGRRPRKTPPPA
jgi:excisionase family DNA binding protein